MRGIAGSLAIKISPIWQLITLTKNKQNYMKKSLSVLVFWWQWLLWQMQVAMYGGMLLRKFNCASCHGDKFTNPIDPSLSENCWST